MLKELADLPAGVIGFEVAGKLTAEDYRAPTWRGCSTRPTGSAG